MVGVRVRKLPSLQLAFLDLVEERLLSRGIAVLGVFSLFLLMAQYTVFTLVQAPEQPGLVESLEIASNLEAFGEFARPFSRPVALTVYKTGGGVLSNCSVNVNVVSVRFPVAAKNTLQCDSRHLQDVNGTLELLPLAQACTPQLGGTSVRCAARRLACESILKPCP